MNKKNNISGILYVSRNKCVSCQKGYIWSYYNSEQKLTATSLSSLKKRVVECGLDWIIIDEVAQQKAFLFDEKGCYEERKTIEKPQKRDFLLDNCFLHPTTMIRIEALVAVCGYTESTKTFPEDYDLWTRMYAYGYKGFNIQQALTYYYKNRLIHSKYGFKHHLISVKIRYESFKRLGLMPIGYLFIMKPLLLPFLPLSLINRMKKLKR